MTKRYLCLGLGLVLLGACLSHVPVPIPLPGEIVIEAQTLPITKTLAWDAEDAGFAVTSYTVKLDGATVGQPTGTTQAVTFTTPGPHTLTVNATNLWGPGLPTTLQVIVQLPAAPANAHIQ